MHDSVMRRTILLIFTWIISSVGIVLPSYAEDATLNGAVINIPVVVFGNTFYQVELSLIEGTNPPEFNLTGGQEITGASSAGSSYLLNQILTIPAIQVESVNYRVQLALFSGNPIQFRLASATVNVSSEESEDIKQQALELFASEIAVNVVQSRCIACHVAGGIARDTGLNFQRANVASTNNNFDVFNTFLAERYGGRDLVLSKVTGGSHTGGIQLREGSLEYKSFADFLMLLDESLNLTPVTDNSGDFFAGVTLETREKTLRRAAIIMGSRLPTEEEVRSVRNGDGGDLRMALRELMQGNGFHQFILDGTNDRLLTEHGSQIVEPRPFYPLYNNRQFANEESDRITGENTAGPLGRAVDRDLSIAPGELIAHIAENDLSYTEVVTADYMMMSPIVNSVLGGTAVFEDEEDLQDFQPGRIDGFYMEDDAAITRVNRFGNVFVEDPGDRKLLYPHAGILNTPAFLKRYPTTPTNRNRARARWTLLNFLDIDVEKSSRRPTDPDALADTNNPTLNNPSCTACHRVMDPVAGAFQNYEARATYRSGGNDALDQFYKHPTDGSQTPFQAGDTWYRDMRAPGLFDQVLVDKDASLAELAQLIIQEPGFARAAVKFWWPAVMGTKILFAPTVVEDDGYAAQLVAYNAQARIIEALAGDFSLHFNLKDLLVEMMMTSWFSPESVDNSEHLDSHIVAELGSEKLLTPEQLHRKTLMLTGFNWRSFFRDGKTVSELEERLRLFYGGIDSFAVTKRSTVITPLMSNLPMALALESACPIVLREFTLPDRDRKLFFGLTGEETPDSDPTAIREKVVELHKILHGRIHAIDSQEIDIAYEILVESWSERVSSNSGDNLFRTGEVCNWASDINIFNGLGFDGDVHVLKNGHWGFNHEGGLNQFLGDTGAVDPARMKQSWVTVMVYMLTHYFYIYE